MIRTFEHSVTGATQAGGAQTISGLHALHRRIQVQVEVSATPTAGTLAMAIKTPGAAGFQTIYTFDLTGDLVPVEIAGRAEALRFTPTSFDAGKTYSAYVCTGV